MFEGFKGSSGVLALDDIEYTVGVDCANQVTDPETSGQMSDNAGAIAASVIVMLLAVGTLVAVLVFYLRSRKPGVQTAAANTPANPPAGRGFSNDTYDGSDDVSSS